MVKAKFFEPEASMWAGTPEIFDGRLLAQSVGLDNRTHRHTGHCIIYLLLIITGGGTPRLHLDITIKKIKTLKYTL
jgi:hypothetical protein